MLAIITNNEQLITNAQCSMPNAQFAIRNFQLNVSIFVQAAAAVCLSFRLELLVNGGSFNNTVEAP